MVSYVDFSKDYRQKIKNQKKSSELMKISNIQFVTKIGGEEINNVVTEDFDYGMASTYAKIADDIDSTVAKYKRIKPFFKDLYLPANCDDLFEESLSAFLNSRSQLTIASVGMLAELFVIHIFELNFEASCSKKELRKKVESFENVSQYGRINILFSIGYIPEDIFQMLHNIRDTRNKVIHPKLTKINYETTANDLFNLILKIFQRYTGLIKSMESKTATKK